MNARLFKALLCPEAIISYKALVRLILFSSTAMISPDLIRTVVGIIGNVIALSLFLSPVPTFCKIWKKGSVEQFSPVPYLATLLNCMLWVVYGLPLVHPHSTLVLTINGLGLIIELTYVLLFLLYSNGRARIRVLAMLLTEIVFVGLITVIVLSTAHTLVTRSLIIGVLCVFFGTMMYAAPLSVMKLVIQTKSVEYMPLFLSVASFLNGICWTTYALIRFDLFITIPNALGTMFSVAQLILHAMYYKSTKIQMEARKRKLEMGFEEVMAPVENMEKIRGASQTSNYPPV